MELANSDMAQTMHAKKMAENGRKMAENGPKTTEKRRFLKKKNFKKK
jgi:hypothetical protein